MEKYLAFERCPWNSVQYYVHLFQVNNLLTKNFVLLQDETAAMDYLGNQEYQATLEYLVLGLLGKLGRLVRTVHGANLGQKVLNFD